VTSKTQAGSQLDPASGSHLPPNPSCAFSLLLFLFRVVAQKDAIFAMCSLVQRIIEGHLNHSFSPPQLALGSVIKQCLLFVTPTENIT
jgi:hypothetical protein